MTDINLNSPNKGLLSDTMTDVPVDNTARARTSAPEGLTEAEEEELRSELAKVKWCYHFCLDCASISERSKRDKW